MYLDWPNIQVRVRSAGRMRCESGWALLPAWSQRLRDFDLWFVWAGRGSMTLNNRQINLHPGCCLWMRPGGRYEAAQDPHQRLGVSYIHFDLVHTKHTSQPRFEDNLPPEVSDLSDIPLIDAMLRRIVELHRHHPAATAQDDSLQQNKNLAAELMRCALMYFDDQTCQQAMPGGTPQRYQRLAMATASRIDEDPGRTESVVQLARQAGYSQAHFSRLFKQVMGLSPQNYIIHARINRARDLLRESELDVGQIADVLGYRDPYFFSRQFKKITNQTPTTYRSQADDHT